MSEKLRLDLIRSLAGEMFRRLDDYDDAPDLGEITEVFEEIERLATEFEESEAGE